jgi:WhiB family redox-sensing transcriptional regulator
VSRKIVKPGADQVTRCKRGHPYTEENSYCPPGRGPAGRMCRQCMRDRQQEARARTTRGRELGFDPLVLPFQPEPWVDKAACRDAKWQTFFPERGEGAGPAKAICARCPVREACLDYALRWNITYGVWGGLSEKQRRRLRSARRAS